MAAKWDSGRRWDDGVTFWDRAVAVARGFARATASFIGSFARQSSHAARGIPRATTNNSRSFPRQTESD